MAIIGNSGTPNQTYGFYGFNNSNVMAIQVTMPEAGTITSLSAYFAAHHGSGATQAALLVWNTSGVQIAFTPNFTLNEGSGGVGGQSFHTASLSSNLHVTNGQQIRIGWWRYASGSNEWTEQNGGSEYQATDSSNTGPPGSESFSTVSGQPSIYATYTPDVSPVITTFSPTHAPAGDTVTISGSGFTGTTSVHFNGVSASFSVVNDGSITATVPTGSTAGYITVTNATGTGQSGATFTPSNIATRRTGHNIYHLVRIRRSGAWIFAPSVNTRRSGAWEVDQ